MEELARAQRARILVGAARMRAAQRDVVFDYVKCGLSAAIFVFQLVARACRDEERSEVALMDLRGTPVDRQLAFRVW